MRDGQRQAVYDWENRIREQFPEQNRTLDFQECQELVKLVWNDYRPGDKPPTVKDGRGRRRASGGRWNIVLPRWSRQMVVVLHEIAHSMRQFNEPWHGRLFARLVVDLWEQYAKISATETMRMGRHPPEHYRRVHFSVAADVPQKPTKAWVEWKKNEPIKFKGKGNQQ